MTDKHSPYWLYTHMIETEWNPNHYPIRSYLHVLASLPELDKFLIKVDDNILISGVDESLHDINLINRVPNGSILGVNTNKEIIQRCERLFANHPNISFQHAEEFVFEFENKFDAVLSLWDISHVSELVEFFQSIHHALKPGGRMMMTLAGRENPLHCSLEILEAQGVIEKNMSDKILYDPGSLYYVEDALTRIPYEDFRIHIPQYKIEIPSLDIYKQYLNEIRFLYEPYFNNEKITEITTAQALLFDEFCKENHNGEYIFEFSPYIITGIK